tara:strand:+ start:42 stop:617 length:576 start_codon:yes stop_codon:yes gene_type:complete
MNNKTKTILTFILTAGVFIFVASPILASHPDAWLRGIIYPDGHLIPSGCTEITTNTGGQIVEECGLSAIFQTIVNFSKLILALTGSVALLMFMYGGVLFIISSGSQEKITKGKEAMKTASIGVIIILGAFLIVNFTIFALTGGDPSKVQTIFTQGFNVEQVVPSGKYDNLPTPLPSMPSQRTPYPPDPGVM